MAINPSKNHDLTENTIITTRGSVPDQPILTAYGPKLRQQLLFIGPGQTKQSFKDECDINRIMARYQVTGVLPEQLKPGTPQYVDVTGIDYLSGMQKIAAAQSLFQGLPAAVRLRFENDPGKFLDFAENPNNQDELVELGLATRPPHEPLPASPEAGGFAAAPAAPLQASTAGASTARSGPGKGNKEVQSHPLPGISDADK